MSDRSAATLYIYALPAFEPDGVNPAPEYLVMHVLEKHGMVNKWDDDPLRLGDDYFDEEASLTIVSELGAELVELGASFMLEQAPKYEYDGEIMIHVAGPPVQHFEGSCNGVASVYVEAWMIDEIMDLPEKDCNTKLTMIRSLTGRDARDALKRLQTGGGA